MKNEQLQSKKYVLDTNFFISGFEKNPADFNIFLEIAQDLEIELYVSNHIMQEIRWYLRRRVKDPVEVIRIPIKEIRDYKEEIEKKQISTPSLNDLSNIVVAQRIGGIVISSDLKLVRTCEALDVPVLISSSFIFLLNNVSTKNEQKIILEKIYDTILSDEIRHSVEKRQTYDPVTRIKKIQEHALSVLQNILKTNHVKQEIVQEQHYLLPEENNLIEIMNEIEFEFPIFLDQLEKGNLEVLLFELVEAYTLLSDLSLELRVALMDKESYTEELAIRLKARILFLLSIAEFTLLDLEKLDGHLNILIEISLVYPKLVSDIFMDLHFLRMVYFLVTNNHERLKGYYSEKFLFLCEKQERIDLLRLTRVVILASTIMESGLIDKRAVIDGKDEISLLIQIGYILLQKEQFEHALLILLQSHYLAVNLKDQLLAKDTLELLVILHYSIKERCTEEIFQGIEDLKELGIFELPNISFADINELQRIVTTEFVSVEDLSAFLKDWFYIYHRGTIIKEGEISSFILMKNPYFSPRIALIRKTPFSSYDTSPGKQIKLFEGNAKISIPKESTIDSYPIDLVIEFQEKDSKFIFRGPFGMKIIL
ncbi:MAG: PIN domain-containing protein [Candidatus Thorarchaeota archaeon]